MTLALVALPLWLIAAKNIIQTVLILREQRYVEAIRKRQAQELQRVLAIRDRPGMETLH